MLGTAARSQGGADAAFVVLLLIAAYIYYVWVRPIMKIRNKSLDTKTKAVSGLTVALFGIIPVMGIVVFLLVRKLTNKGQNNLRPPNVTGRQGY